MNPFQSPGSDELKNMSGLKAPRPSNSLFKNKSRGFAIVPKKAPAEEDLEPLEELPIDSDPEEKKSPDLEALLSFGAWSKPDTCFHEEAEVSVKLNLPEDKKHLTRIEAELHAKMESGLKLIAKTEAHAKPDGTAVFTLPVYQPEGYQEGVVKYALTFRHKLSKPLSSDDLLRPVSKMALKSADHVLIPGIAFSKDSSFIGPKAASGLKKLESKALEWERKYPKQTRIVVYGHATADEKEPKALSERRAQSAYAFIIGDAEAWEKIYGEEKWGLVVFQVLLKELGHFAGKPDGLDGTLTQAAFKSFQKKADLPETGKEDSSTRTALFAAYMKGAHDIRIDASRFRMVAANPWMGCGANNQAQGSGPTAPENRRVAFILSKESKLFPPNFPCQDGKETSCGWQCKRKGERSTPGIKCLFYDELVREEKQDAGEADVSVAQEEPPWMPIARKEIGVTEIRGNKHNDKILEYHATTWLKAESDETAWCASFVNWCLKESGYTPLNSPRAKNWKTFGREVKNPVYGSIAIVHFGKDRFHVGFVAGKKGKKTLLLGGNQGGGTKVCVTEIDTGKIEGYRLPKEYKGSEIEAQESNGEYGQDDYAGTR